MISSPKATCADHRGNDDHRERHHDALVDTGHDGTEGEGSLMKKRIVIRLAPNASPASITSRSTPPKPWAVRRIGSGMAKKIVATMPGTVPTPKKNTGADRCT